MVYSQHGFGPSTTDRSEVDNLIAYLKQSPMNQVNIIYLDGIDVSSGTGSNPSTVPTLQAFPNYAYAVEQLHEMGKTVILVSALSDGDVNLNSGTVVSDLETIVSNTPNGIHADGLAFDDEISKANQLYFADNQAALATLAQNEVAQKKYFGIVTNLGGSQEGAIAPLFDNVTCQANANATDYCFESIMRYDGGDGTPEQASLKYEMHYIAHINKVNFYNATPSTNTHQRIIRIMLPVTYSGGSYPTIESDGSAPNEDAGYSYQNFICDMSKITDYWLLGSLAPFTTDLCPANLTYYIHSGADINSGGELFSAADNLVFGGADFYRIVDADYATNKPEGGAPLSKDHYLCDPSGQSGNAFDCPSDYLNQNYTKWVPTTVLCAPLLSQNLFSIQSYDVSDTQKKFVITHGKPNETCRLSIPGGKASLSDFSLDSNGASTVSVSVSNSSTTTHGQANSYSLSCSISGELTHEWMTRNED